MTRDEAHDYLDTLAGKGFDFAIEWLGHEWVCYQWIGEAWGDEHEKHGTFAECVEWLRRAVVNRAADQPAVVQE